MERSRQAGRAGAGSNVEEVTPLIRPNGEPNLAAREIERFSTRDIS